MAHLHQPDRDVRLAVGTADQWHLDAPVRLLEQQIQPLGYAAKFTYLAGWHFALVEKGKEIDRFNIGVMTRIVAQMYQRARPQLNWAPKTPPHPASQLTRH